MKKQKRLASILLSLLLLFSNVSGIHAYSTISMIQSGSKYIYSNNPEAVTGSVYGSNGKYTIEQALLKNTSYVFEYYHHNWTGSNKKFGIAIKNNNSTSAQIRVVKEALTTSSNTLTASTTTLKNYGNSSKDVYVTIPANGTIFLQETTVQGSNIVNGKIKFIPTKSNISARVFFSSTSSSSNSIFNLSRATSTNTSMTTGYFAHDTRYANVDINNIHENTFYLSAYNSNTNEYETGSNVLGSSKLLGNFGIIYDIQLKNCSGKRIKITPNLDSPNATQAQLVLWKNNNIGWYRTTYINDNSSTKFWLMSVPSDQNFKFSLPGGNFGNVKFEIID